jgi:hypothetical protein
MNHEQSLQLADLMRTNNTVDNTPVIRELKHSKKIRRCAEKIEQIKIENPHADVKELNALCMGPASFLFRYYTIIYNKLIRSQIDMNTLHIFLDKIRDIENGQLTQQEAAYDIGMLLKKLYIDPRMNEKEELKEPEYIKGKNINWNDFKNMKITE